MQEEAEQNVGLLRFDIQFAAEAVMHISASRSFIDADMDRLRAAQPE